MPETSRQPMLRYGLAVLAVALALAFTLAVRPGLELEGRLLLFLGAVLASAWYGGLGPGLLAIALAVQLSERLPPAPLWPPWPGAGLNLPLTVFVVEGLLISVLGAQLHEAWRAGRIALPETGRRPPEDDCEPALTHPPPANAAATPLPVEAVARLCHDLRSPLNAILGWVQLRHSGALDPATEARAWAAIERSAKTQARLIDDLRDTARDAAADRPGPAMLPAHNGISSLRILIVDDDADAREVLRAILDRAGAEVLCCGSAPEALTMSQLWRPDALVSDLGMPGDDGYALITKIRALAPRRGGAVPAIALSGFTEAEARRRALAAGFQVFLPKPVEPTRLLAALAALTQRDHALARR